MPRPSFWRSEMTIVAMIDQCCTIVTFAKAGLTAGCVSDCVKARISRQIAESIENLPAGTTLLLRRTAHSISAAAGSKGDIAGVVVRSTAGTVGRRSELPWRSDGHSGQGRRDERICLGALARETTVFAAKAITCSTAAVVAAAVAPGATADGVAMFRSTGAV
jgi:hypothetical protein